MTAPLLSQLFAGMATASTVIFGISTLVGLWAAYDRTVALGRFALLILGLSLCVLLAWSTWQKQRKQPDPLQSFHAVGVDSGLVAGGIGLLFLLTHNWQNAAPEDFTPLPWLTTWIQTQQPLWGERLLIHENLVAGALMVLLPLAIVTLWQRWQMPARWYQLPLRYWALAGVVIGAGALLLTFSRSAWFGLLGGALGAGYLYWRTDNTVNECRERHRDQLTRHDTLAERPLLRFRRWLNFFLKDQAALDWSVTVGLLISIVLLVGMTLSPTVRAAVLQPVAGTYLERTIDSRLAAWQEALPLIQDYPLTGSGLGSTAMVLASYVYLLHVPYLYHAHSLYLQVAVEQGLPGLIGWVGMSLSALGLGVLWLHEGTQQGRLCAAGALAAQIALLIYGATDAELYVGIFVPFLFLPAALLFACAPHGILPTMEEAPGSIAGGTESAGQQRVATHGRRRQQSMGALLPLLVLLVLLMGPGGESRWLANQSAIGQTRQELARYEWPLWPLQDALRRSDEIDTEHWVIQYEAILQRDPTNVTALRRLGQIALSQGDYAQADRLLSAAYRLAPQQRATRQLLGEVKALLGNPTEAAALWQNLDLSQGQPDLRLWWYEHADGAAAAQPFADFLKHRQSLH